MHVHSPEDVYMKVKISILNLTTLTIFGISLIMSSEVSANSENDSTLIWDESIHTNIRQKLISEGFEKFKEGVYKEPFENGVFIVNGDTPIANEEKLREFFNSVILKNYSRTSENSTYRISENITHEDLLSDSKPFVSFDKFLLDVNKSRVDASTGGRPNPLRMTEKLKMTYCVSNKFGTKYASVIEAFALAASHWEQASQVKFEHVSAYDSDCNAKTNVRFDIRPTTGGEYFARAFFPKDSRPYSNVLIDDSSFGQLPADLTLEGILTHEIGHILAFRHEQIQPEPGKCFEEEDPWVQLNDHDEFSVMRYPQCSKNKSWLLVLSEKDKVGAACLYGAPAGSEFNKSKCKWRNK